MKRFNKIIALMTATVVSASVFSSCSLSSVNDKTPITIEKKQSDKVERLPGIVCWGSTMSYGSYGEGNSIHNTIEDHMMSDECYIPIINMGVPRETTHTVMARSGAVDILVKAFTIPESIEQVEIKLYSADGSDIFPLRFGTRWTGGMSNVTIAGVQGTLAIDETSAQFEEPIYYFTRNKEGEEIKVEKGEKLISESMTNYVDYIPVVCIGDDGGWETFDELIEQQQAIIDTSTNSDKFIVVGLFSVPLTEEQLKSVGDDAEAKAELIKKNNEAYDKAMEEHWGEHYVNSREYLCSNVALEKLQSKELEITTEDKVNMSEGVVPDIVKYDITHLNGYGYVLIGDAVYDRMVELGYLYH